MPRLPGCRGQKTGEKQKGENEGKRERKNERKTETGTESKNGCEQNDKDGGGDLTRNRELKT